VQACEEAMFDDQAKPHLRGATGGMRPRIGALEGAL
jgi:hypothetical protein